MTLQTYMAGLIFLERTQKEDINISDTRKSSSDERDKKKISISSIDGIKIPHESLVTQIGGSYRKEDEKEVGTVVPASPGS